nr:hypothetical protein [Nocardia nova]
MQRQYWAHITLSMLALAWLSPSKAIATKGESAFTTNRHGSGTGFGVGPAPVGVVLLRVVRGFAFGRGQVVEQRVKMRVVVPVAPLHERELDLGERFERTVPIDHLGLEQADDRFCQGVAIGIAD